MALKAIYIPLRKRNIRDANITIPFISSEAFSSLVARGAELRLTMFVFSTTARPDEQTMWKDNVKENFCSYIMKSFPIVI